MNGGFSNVAVIDVGSRDNIGWAIDGSASSEGSDVDGFIAAIDTALDAGPLALGFEAPMFVPMHEDSANLTRARRGEGNRAFSVGAGASSLVCGLVVAPYVLSRLAKRAPMRAVTFDWRMSPGQNTLLLFEAFITQQGHQHGDGRHVADAKLAIVKFDAAMRHPESVVSALEEANSFNLLGAALLRTGWTDDLAVLAQRCLVVMQRGAPDA